MTTQCVNPCVGDNMTHSVSGGIRKLRKSLLVFCLGAFAISPHYARAEFTELSFPKLARALGLKTENGTCASNTADLTEREKSVRWNNPDVLASEWGCLKFAKNLDHDSLKSCNIDPSTLTEQLNSLVLKSNPFQTSINGYLKYEGIKKGRYSYDLEKIESSHGPLKWKVTVRLHFIYITPEQLNDLNEKLRLAEKLWSDNSPDKSIEFHFNVVDSSDDAHFTLKMGIGDKRTPYYHTWWTHWTAQYIAHEIGHTMGLDDEYNQMRVILGRFKNDAVEESQCQFSSIMCTAAQYAKPQRYHYYLLMRRAVCLQ